MTNWMRKAIMTAGAAALSLSVLAAAEVGGTYNATVPHSFNIGNKLMPAGEYKITSVAPNVITFFNVGTSDAAALVAAVPLGDSKGAPRLVLREYGGTWKIAEFWGISSGIGRVRTSAERAYDAERPAGTLALVPLKSLR